MKILIIGENNINSLERIYKKNFKKLNCKTVNLISHFNPKNFFLKKALNFYEKYFFLIYCLIQNYFLKKKIILDKNSYDIVIVFNGYYLFKKTINILKKKSKISLINIQTDNIFEKKNILKNNLKFFDKVYVWSLQLKKKIRQHKNIKPKSILLLPFGFDQFLIKKNNELDKIEKILFYGSWDKKREYLLNQIDNKILNIYGNGWENADEEFTKKFLITNELIGMNLLKKVSKSLLCINLFRNQAKNSMNMRSFEVIAYGGSLLSEYSSEQKQYFKKFKGILYFKNIKQVNKIYTKALLNKKKLIKERRINFELIKTQSYYYRAKYILKNENI